MRTSEWDLQYWLIAPHVNTSSSHPPPPPPPPARSVFVWPGLMSADTIQSWLLLKLIILLVNLPVG